jgi:hypothetical protein
MGAVLCRCRSTRPLSLPQRQPCSILQPCYISWKPVAHNSIVLHFRTTVKLQHTSRGPLSRRSGSGTAGGLILLVLVGVATRVFTQRSQPTAQLPEGQRLEVET